MSIVIIEQDGMRRGCILEPRTLIGRWPSNTIVIDDPSVSRVHAWISETDDGCFLTDAQSRAGTKVNGRSVTLRRRLRNGDEIRIGPCSLVFQPESGLPEGIEPYHQPGSSDTGFPGTGILFDCHCGAPLWAPVKMAGLARRCHYCRAVILIPPRGGMTAQSPTDGITCSICQWRIDDGHSSATCPECGLVFHVECWTENQGCSSYGCSQVNALVEPGAGEGSNVNGDEYPQKAPWEAVLLTSSIAATILGMLAFGVPALIVAVASVVYYFHAEVRSLWLAIASAVSLVGIVAGLVASFWWWF